MGGINKVYIYMKNALLYLSVVYGLVGLVLQCIGFALLVKWIPLLSCLYSVVGEIMLIIAAIGCLSATVQESYSWLNVYTAFILVIFVLQMVLVTGLSKSSCYFEAAAKNFFEMMFGDANTPSDYHKARPKECDSSFFEVLTSIIAFSLCSAFNDRPCVSKQDAMFARWYIPINIVIVGILIIEAISGLLGVVLATILETKKEMRSRAAESKTKEDITPVAEQASVC